MTAARAALAVVGGTLLAILAAGVGLQALVALGDDAHPWRSEAYQAAVDASLRASAARTGVAPLRDFTDMEIRRAPTFLPCTLSLRELQDAPGRCTAVPGPRPKPDVKLCRGAGCIVLGLTPETWADPAARDAVVATLRDPAAICRAATDFARNHAASARAAGCGGRRLERVHLVVALIPRRPHPCRAIPLSGSTSSYSVRCDPAPARQIALS